MNSIITAGWYCQECARRFFSESEHRCPFCKGWVVESQFVVPEDLLREVTDAKWDLEATEVPYELSGRFDMASDVLYHRNMVQRWQQARQRLWEAARPVVRE